MSFCWSQAAVRLLHGFYLEQGLSAGQTAAALGRELGDAPTRHAVLGKAQRMGWLKPPAERAPEPPRSEFPGRSEGRSNGQDPCRSGCCRPCVRFNCKSRPSRGRSGDDSSALTP